MIRLEQADYAPGGYEILRNFGLVLQPGTINALVGPSGCGKSSLLRVLAGLRPLDGGTLTGVPSRKAFVFQDAALLPWCTAWENVAMVGKFGPIGDVGEALARVGLTEHAHKLPSQLSGGQRMRVSLARVLVGKPELVLLDEAFSALDGLNRRAAQRVFLRLAEQNRWTVVMVTHEPEDAMLLSDRVLAVVGPPLRILQDHQNAAPRPRQLPDFTLWEPAPALEPEASDEESLTTLASVLPGERVPTLLRQAKESMIPKPTRSGRLPAGVGRQAAGVGLALLAGGVAWQLVALKVGPMLLPAPLAVATAFVTDGLVLGNATLQTGRSAGLGLLIAFVAAYGSAVLAWASRSVRFALLPYVTFLQIVPIIAIAPLLVVWLGYGGGVPLTTATIACFYPIYSAAATGLVAASADQVDLLRLYGANRWQELWYLRLPASLPSLFVGLRTAAGLSVIGAIVGEFVGSNGAPSTLGFLVVFSARSARTEEGFAAIVCAGLLSLLFSAVLGMLERRAIGRWFGA